MEISFTEVELKEVGKFFLATDKENHEYHAEIKNIFLNKRISKNIISFILHRCNHHSKFIDVGANLGLFTLPIAKNGARVLAVEPLAENYYFLNQSIQKNNFSHVILSQVAVGRKMGIVKMEGTSAWAQVSQKATGVSVPLVTLDSLAELYDFTDADCIKIDVEGSELDTLVGMEKILKNNENLEIIFEGNVYTCGVFGYSLQELKQFFINQGYNLYIFLGNQIQPITVNDPPVFTVGDFLATKKDISKLPSFNPQSVSLKQRKTSLQVEISSNSLPNKIFASKISDLLGLNNEEKCYIKQNYEAALLNKPTAEVKYTLEKMEIGLGLASLP